MTSTTPDRLTERSAERSLEEDESERTGMFRPFGAPAAAQAEWREPEGDASDAPAKTRHIVDRFDGAAGLFLLRLTVAVVLGIRGLQKVQHLDVTQAQLTELGLPYVDVLSLVIGVGQLAIAVALVLGVLVRVAGLGLAILGIGALYYGAWRTGDWFFAGVPGFNGETKLLLAGIGFAFLGLGGGGWTVDRRFRRR